MNTSSYEPLWTERRRPGDDSWLGGVPRMPPKTAWPIDAASGRAMTHMLSLGHETLKATVGAIAWPQDACVSVFVAVPEKPSDASVHARLQGVGLEDDTLPCDPSASAVLMHRGGAAIAMPPVVKGSSTPNLLIPCLGLRFESTQDEVVVNGCSNITDTKLGGAPGWVQDPVVVPGKTFLMQLNCYLFATMGGSRLVAAIGDGTAYAFIDPKPKFGLIGHLFLQSS